MANSISRRRIVKTGTGLLVASAALGTAGAWAANPKRGGDFRLAIDGGNLNDNLDPALTNSSHIQQLNYLTRNWLVDRSPDGKIGPGLAEEFEPSADAASWTFRLRRDVEFHNGKTMTAEDARLSILHHIGEDSKSAAKSLLTDIDDIEILDPLTFRIKLTSGNVDLPYLLYDYHMVVLPAGPDGMPDATSGIGTGPYRLTRFEPGVISEHERFGNHWRDDRGHFDSVRLIAMNDANARLSALLTGEAHAMSRVDNQFADRLAQRDDINLLEAPAGSHTTFPMWTDAAPFDNNDVRLALKYAIDREALVSSVLMGRGVLGNDQPINASYPEWAQLDQRQFDPDRARFHLERAGLSELSVDLHVSDAGNVGTVDTAVLWQQHAARAGITINVVREPEDGYWSNVWLKKPFVASAWGERPSAYVMLANAYAAGAPWNETHFDHERFESLMSQVKLELDESRRMEMFAELQTIIRDEGGVVIPFFNNRLAGTRANVGVVAEMEANFAPPGGMYAIDRWWFDT